MALQRLLQQLVLTLLFLQQRLKSHVLTLQLLQYKHVGQKTSLEVAPTTLTTLLIV